MKSLTVMLILTGGIGVGAQPSATQLELERFVGAYQMPDGSLARVVLLKDSLRLEEPGHDPKPLRHVAARDFNSGSDQHSTRVQFSGESTASAVVTITRAADRHLGRRVTVPEEDLRSYAGAYPLSDTLTMHVTFEAGQLHVQAPGASKHPLFPESATRFFVQDYNAEDVALLDFAVESGGNVDVVISQAGASQKVRRK